ncbi:MAG: efflux RND transporter periplasmic adaptor subunit [Sedimentisphaerales bacterium]|nr:efflux RND transporter periplasmic adaptor subunit [Sedimentisphaerales bacterium]
MKKSRIIIVTVIVTLVVVAVLGLILKAKLAPSHKPTVVRIEKPATGRLVEYVSAPGEIEPKTNVEISAKISARIVSLPYEEGDLVTAGDPNAEPPLPPSVVVRLDAKDLESQLLSAQAARNAQAAQIEVENARIAGQKASLIGLEASLQQAEIDLKRQESLLESNDISQSAFDKAKLSFDDLTAQHRAAQHTLKAAELNLTVLKHNLEAADARIDQAREALSYTTITSPIDGTITRLNAEVGEVVITGTMNNPGTVIMEIGDLSQMLLVAQVDEADVPKVEIGQKAIIHVDAFPEREFNGIVDSIALSHTYSRTATKYYRTEILIEESNAKLYSGLTAHVDIETKKHENILKLPSQAVLGKQIDSLPLDIRENSELVDPNKTYATVVFRYVDGKTVITPVKIGQADLTHTIIEAGISEKDDVITGPYNVLEKLRHDQPVIDERQAAKKKTTAAKTTTEPNKPINDSPN